MELLKVEKITKIFVGLIALKDVDFSIKKGELVGLIGPNGAGKSTMFNVLSGFYRPTSGNVFFLGEDITGMKTHKIVRKGLIRTFQQTKLFMELTVLENVKIACDIYEEISTIGDILGIASCRRSKAKSLEDSRRIIKLCGLEEVSDMRPKNLPHGFQRALGIAIAVAAHPKLLCLDEPVTGMNFEEIKFIINLINKLREEGTTILLVEHTMRVIMEICDRVIVLNFGEKIAEGGTAEIRKNVDVVEAYLGKAF